VIRYASIIFGHWPLKYMCVLYTVYVLYEAKVKLSLCYVQPTKTLNNDNGRTLTVATAGGPVPST